ncbi:MAG: hypothetical protein OEX77_12130 [Candidatus Bathyarchaeota archaeon]|nr:hypothetical protein [Candidatus Bathyarchaeota archaeon]
MKRKKKVVEVKIPVSELRIASKKEEIKVQVEPLKIAKKKSR